MPLDDERLPEVAGSVTDPGSNAAKRELQEIMDALIESALPEERHVVLLRDDYGADWGEMAREFERTRHVCQQLHQCARISLRLQMMRKVRGL